MLPSLLPVGANRFDSVCADYSAAYRKNGRSNIADYLDRVAPNDRPALALELLQVDIDCRRRHGEVPRPEDYPDIVAALPPEVAVGIFQSISPPESGPRTQIDPVLNLFAQWKLAQRFGLELTPEELCASYPHLLEELRERIGSWNPEEPERPAPDPEPQPELALGPDIIDVKFHARGGMGEVYIGTDRKLNRRVAVKLVRPQHQHRAEVQWRFDHEARVTALLDHPGVVPVHAAGQTPDGRPFYTMRFVKGQSFKSAIEAFHDEPPERKYYSLRFRELLRRFVAVCETVAYAHGKGVIHRDLKPANVMLGAYGETLVVDWGLARRNGTDEIAEPSGNAEPTGDTPPTRLTVTGAVVGTPLYMAPEQADGQAVGPPADVYSLGTILYELLVGRPAFSGGRDEVLGNVRNGRWTPPRRAAAAIPAALEAVVMKAMARGAGQRYGSPLELATDVTRWLGDEPVSAWREPWTSAAWRWARRYRAAVVGVTLATILGLAATTVATFAAVRQAWFTAEAERGRLFDQRVAISRAAFGRGKLSDALSEFDRMCELGRPVDPKLRFEAARACFNRYDRKRMEHELSIIEKEGPDSALRGSVLLLRANLIFEQNRSALASLVARAMEEELTPAEKQFADALIADTTPKSIACLQRAIALDPRYLEARSLLGVLLALSGRWPEAARVADDTLLLYPDHMNSAILQTVACAFRGDSDKATKHLNGLRDQLPRDLYELIRCALLAIPLAEQELEIGAYGRSRTLAEQFNYWSVMASLVSHQAKAGIDATTLFPPVIESRTGEMAHLLMQLLNLYNPGRQPIPGYKPISAEEFVQRLERFTRVHPEGLTKFLYGFRLMNMAIEAMLAKRPEAEIRAKYAAAGRAMEDAANTPAIFNIRVHALECAAGCYGAAGRPTWSPDRQEEYVRKAAEMAELRWRMDKPVHSSRLPLLTKVVFNDVKQRKGTVFREMLSEWERQSPGDIGAAKLRAEVEYDSGAYETAIKAAELVLTKEPGHVEMREMIDKCRAKLK